MKKILPKILSSMALGALLITGTPTIAEANVSAVPSNQTMYVNDEYTYIKGYNINGNNYFKLRDVAYAMGGTSSNFNVTWDENNKRINLITNTDYEGKAPVNDYSNKKITAVANQNTIAIDGQTVALTAYNIQGNNYFKLRDLGKALNFSVDWISGEREFMAIYTGLNDGVTVTSNTTGTARYNTASMATNYWGTVTQDYIFRNANGTINTLAVANNKIQLITYSEDFQKVIENKTISMPLDIFGGFYAGEQYNYIVFGTTNPSETPSKEILQIVKYDKNFNQIDSVTITTGESFTKIPFDASNCSISEGTDGLVIHTSRERLLTDDGLNHQSQLTIIIDPATMQIKNELSEFQPNHVSHSFTQRVQFNGDHHVLIDHGDAYPRSIVLHKYNGSYYDELDLFKISGATGENKTGVKLGGFEVTANNYLVAISSINQSKPSSTERDVILLISNKTNADTNQVKQITLTNYIGNSKIAGEPKLVRISNNQFLVMWDEYNSANWDFNGVKYVMVDENGNKLNDIQTLKEGRLSGCQPIYINDEVVWYCDGYGKRLFYSVGPFKSNGDIAELKEEVFVQNLTVTPSNKEIPVGETFQLSTAISPANVTNKTITYQSSNSSIATVSSTGLIIAKEIGYATITATSSNGKTATCSVKVTSNQNEVTSLSFYRSSLELTEGDTCRTGITIYPSNATDKDVTYHSSNTSVATVSYDGTITAKKAGYATITATSSNGKTATCSVIVTPKTTQQNNQQQTNNQQQQGNANPTNEVTFIAFNSKSINMKLGDFCYILAYISPSNATNKTVTFHSSDESIATVSSVDTNRAVVRAKNVGTVTITATAASGLSTTCTVTIEPSEIIDTNQQQTGGQQLEPQRYVALSAINFERDDIIKLNVGETYQTNLKFNPSNATNKTVVYTSSDESIATVSSTGLITAKAGGSVRIRAESGVCNAELLVWINGENQAAAEELYRMSNEARQRKGIPSLLYDSSKQAYAHLRAREAVTSNQNGMSYSMIIASQENIAYGDSIAILMNRWENTSGQYDNLFNQDYDAVTIGVYYYNGSYYGIQLFHEKSS